jgi:cell division septum initiation protein DivIVA
MDFLAEINSVKAELADLKTQIQSATGEREIVLRNQIIATQNTLTEYVKLLPKSG